MGLYGGIGGCIKNDGRTECINRRELILTGDVIDIDDLLLRSAQNDVYFFATDG